MNTSKEQAKATVEERHREAAIRYLAPIFRTEEYIGPIALDIAISEARATAELRTALTDAEENVGRYKQDLATATGGKWAQWSLDLAKAQQENAELRAKTIALDGELESHAWEVSPSMAQAKIDQLNASNAELLVKLEAANKHTEEARDQWRNWEGKYDELRAELEKANDRTRKLVAIGLADSRVEREKLTAAEAQVQRLRDEIGVAITTIYGHTWGHYDVYSIAKKLDATLAADAPHREGNDLAASEALKVSPPEKVTGACPEGNHGPSDAASAPPPAQEQKQEGGT